MFLYNKKDLTLYLKHNVAREALIKQRKKDGDIYYYNTPSSFDIETTSYTYKSEKCAFIVVFCVSIFQGGFSHLVAH